MVVRIRLSRGSPVCRSATPAGRNTALLLSSLMTPVALMAFALGFWRLASDAGWTGTFAIADGPFSRWQIWLATGVIVQFAAFLLQRAGSRDEEDASVATAGSERASNRMR